MYYILPTVHGISCTVYCIRVLYTVCCILYASKEAASKDAVSKEAALRCIVYCILYILYCAPCTVIHTVYRVINCAILYAVLGVQLITGDEKEQEEADEGGRMGYCSFTV